mmetsp:Transcript_24949/g.4130  ORF Transcript_24949/g.4130 Transcript_24949/m.4130 type:complete len:87 (+) Transcript_24949:294-554(+)
MTGRKLPPEWHGWLHRQYDDIPNPGNREFEQPFYKRMHEDNPSAKPLPPFAQGHITSQNNEQFKAYIKARVYASWNPESKETNRYD